MAVTRVDGEGDTEEKGSAGGNRRRRFLCQLLLETTDFQPEG